MDIELRSYGAATNSLSVGNVTLAAGKTLKILTAGQLGTGGLPEVTTGGTITLGAIGGTATSVLDINAYTSSTNVPNNVAVTQTGAITGVGKVLLSYTGGSAVLDNSGNELSTVVLNNNQTIGTKRGQLSLLSKTSLTLDYSYKTYDGAVASSISTNDVSGAAVEITTTSKNGTHANLTFANTETNLSTSDSRGLKGFKGLNVVTSGNVVLDTNALVNPTGGHISIINDVNGTIDLRSGAKLETDEFGTGRSIALGKTNGTGGGITIAVNASVIADGNLTLNGKFVYSLGTVKAGILKGTITGTNTVNPARAAADFATLSSNTTGASIIVKDFTVTGTATTGFKVASADGLQFGNKPVYNDAGDAIVTPGDTIANIALEVKEPDANGIPGARHGIDITSNEVDPNNSRGITVYGKVNGAGVKLKAHSINSGIGSLLGTGLDLETTGADTVLMNLQDVNPTLTTITNLTVAGKLQLNYTSAVEFSTADAGTRLTVKLLDTAATDSSIGTTEGKITVSADGGLTIRANTGRNINIAARDGIDVTVDNGIRYFVLDGISEQYNETGTLGLRLTTGSELNLTESKLPWKKISSLSGENLTLVVNRGSDSINIGAIARANLKTHYGIAIGDTAIALPKFDQIIGLTFRLVTTGAINVANADLDLGKNNPADANETGIKVNYDLRAGTSKSTSPGSIISTTFH